MVLGEAERTSVGRQSVETREGEGFLHSHEVTCIIFDIDMGEG